VKRTAVAAALVLPLLLGSCTGSDTSPTAKDAASDLATALGDGHLTGLRFDGGTPREAQALWSRTVAGMGKATPRVTVGRVTEHQDGPATARLSYTWTLPGGAPWRYDTTARLSQGPGGAWRVRLDPALVHPALRDRERLVVGSVLGKRGDILGADGRHLVTARPVLRFGIDKAQVPPVRQAASARALAGLVGVEPGPFVDQVRKAGAQAFVEAIVLRPADAGRALRAVSGIPGAGVLRDSLPLAPTRDFARPILGTVGPVTAEVVQASKGVYAAGDDAGLSGLEQRYDARLRGTPGSVVDAVDARGRRRALFTVPPKPGQPLVTTLDERLQSLAETALAAVRPASALVAVRPSSGAILAAASGPGSAGLSTATVGRYAPGSTFKVVSSLALLRAGVRPGTMLSCPPTTVVDGKTFKNYDDYPSTALGRIPLATAVADSCNTAFINQRDTVSQAELADAAATLGLGVDHDLGFPAYFGSVPATDAEAGSTTGHAASLIGQGRVLASPLAMASVAASVGKGALVVPRLLPAQKTDAPAPDKPLTAREAASLRRLMRGVVSQGSGSFLAGLPGPPVLAKTGTAEFGDKEPLRTHAWMIAVHGDLAVAVFVDVGQSGSATAGPVLEQFLRGAR
jgi:cell division protein FtsI/penicillin-binding protein 2